MPGPLPPYPTLVLKGFFAWATACMCWESIPIKCKQLGMIHIPWIQPGKKHVKPLFVFFKESHMCTSVENYGCAIWIRCNKFRRPASCDNIHFIHRINFLKSNLDTRKVSTLIAWNLVFSFDNIFKQSITFSYLRMSESKKCFQRFPKSPWQWISCFTALQL